MGISTTAAIIGSAVIGGGAALAASSNAADATQNASDAQVAQNDKALALQQSEFNTTQAEYAPWRTVGAGALQMLARTENINVPTDTFSYYGLTSPANSNAPTTGGTTPGASQAGQPDWNAYIAANPDVAAWIQQGHGDPSLGSNQTPAQAAAYQYQNSGKSEGRPLPTISATANPTAPPANNTLTTATTSGPQAFDANGLPIANTPGKPTGLPTSATSSSVPPGGNPRYGDFYASPDYQFRLNQGEEALTGNAAAKGLLDAGSTGKGLINYGQQAASQEFGNWYNRIAALAGVGQTAVAGSTAAGQANVNAQTGIIQNTGASQASSIATQGGINSGLISSLGGTAAGLINNLGTSTSAPANSNVDAAAINAGAVDFGAAAQAGANRGLFGPPI